MSFGDEHDFKLYPELTNSEIAEFGFSSPHVQIVEDFSAVVVRVHDGDTVTLRCDFRDFNFPLRFLSVDAPELNTGSAGEEARDFVKEMCEGQVVEVKVDRNNRVDKYGRLLGDVVVAGQNVGMVELMFGFALPFERRMEGEMVDLNKMLAVKQWF